MENKSEYTLKEVSELTGLSRRQLWRLCKEGKIKNSRRQANGCIIETIIPATELAVLANRRKAGRPAGAKNKPKKNGETKKAGVSQLPPLKEIYDDNNTK